jgi:hypothetical protein
MLKESVLNVEVSCFRNYDTPQNPVTINLMTWLTSTKYKDKVEAIRSIDDKSKRDAIKATLPAITPSGIFSYRSQSSLLKHTGMIQIDLDLTEKNKLITNWKDLKSELIKLPEIAYLGKSASGRGYWGLIPIPPDPKNHKLYFESLEEIFLETWGIELDNKPKNVASLRGYSFDDEAHFNHEAKPFLIKKIQVPKSVSIVKNKGIKASGLGDWIIKKLEASPEGQRHGDRLKLARYAGGLVKGGYLDSKICDSLIQSYLSQYSHADSHQIQAKEVKAIQDGFNEGLKAPIQLEDSQRPKFEKYQSVFVTPSKIETDQITSKDSLDDYINHLHYENGILINGMGYPADWDLIGSYTDQRTKDFIRMAVKNSLLIEFRAKFDLS